MYIYMYIYIYHVWCTVHIKNIKTDYMFASGK